MSVIDDIFKQAKRKKIIKESITINAEDTKKKRME